MLGTRDSEIGIFIQDTQLVIHFTLFHTQL